MRSHNYQIDKLRTIAICGVLTNHIALCNYKLFPINDKGMLFFYHCLQRLSLFAVPLFIMISGFLLLGKSYNYSFEKLYKQKIPRFLMCLLIYGSAFAWIELVFEQRTISVFQVPIIIWNTIQGKTWDHMWYLYMYLGLLIFYPVLRLFFVNADLSEKKWVILSGVFFSGLVLTRHIGINYPLESIYPTLFIVGGGIREWYDDKNVDRNRMRWYAGLGIVCCSLIVLVLAYCNEKHQSELTKELLAAPKLIMCALAASIFIAVLFKTSNPKVYFIKLVQTISEYSFGVYIYHMFWINIIYKVLKINLFAHGFFASIVFYVLTWIVVLVLSIVSTAISKKLPILKKLI